VVKKSSRGREGRKVRPITCRRRAPGGRSHRVKEIARGRENQAAIIHGDLHNNRKSEHGVWPFSKQKKKRGQQSAVVTEFDQSRWGGARKRVALKISRGK